MEYDLINFKVNRLKGKYLAVPGRTEFPAPTKLQLPFYTYMAVSHCTLCETLTLSRPHFARKTQGGPPEHYTNKRH